MPYLLNIHIGPVQEFIASARRCQDLWYGSWLLSQLSRSTAEYIQDQNAQAIVFPGGLARGQVLSQDSSVANKVLAIIPGDAEAVRAVAEGAKEAMLARLQQLARPVFDVVYGGLWERGESKGLEMIPEALDMAWQQVMDLMEFQWVGVPYETENYHSARKQAERLLQAAKNTKPWEQPTWSRPGWRKSSLDGIRETVIPDPFFERQADRTKEAHAKWLYEKFRVRPTERLCGVGLLKRWGFDAEGGGAGRGGFHSTSHMAAAPLRERAEAMAKIPGVASAWNDYRSLLKKAPFHEQLLLKGEAHALFGNYDGSVLFPNRLREVFFAGEDARGATGPYAEVCKEAEQALKRLLAALSADEPNGYYMLLLADGDRMGAAIDHQKTVDGHRAISKALDHFAKSVEAIVSKHRGSLIYSGGDDVLAMLPLHTGLACAQELAEAFAKKLAAFPTDEGLLPTLSVGLAIAHHLEDFARVRAWAGLAEKRAKNGGRNSLAIRLEKRGGSPVEACGCWTPQDKDDDTFMRRLQTWIGLHAERKVPNKLPFQWTDLVRLAKDNPAVDDLVMLEARRLLARKDQKEAGAMDVSAIQAYLGKQTAPAVLESLCQELLLAKEIERASSQAKAPREPQEVL
jgi:CRISPR-associated protein Cmr2